MGTPLEARNRHAGGAKLLNGSTKNIVEEAYVPMCIYINARAPWQGLTPKSTDMCSFGVYIFCNVLGGHRVDTNWDHICHLAMPKFWYIAL